jgi:GT2 family glycosyltransferase
MRTASTDLVLLNSDTEVTDGWLQRLHNCLASDDRIATATPWSNNGEIVSIPDFCVANPPPSSPDRIARVIAACGVPEYPEMPTAVGFCMAVSLRAIDLIGLFDEETVRKMIFVNVLRKPVCAMCYVMMPTWFITAMHLSDRWISNRMQ